MRPTDPTADSPCAVSGEPQQVTLPESHRSVTVAATPDGSRCSLIVMRLGHSRQALLAMSFHGVRSLTALLGAAEAATLLERLARAAPLTPDQRRLLAEVLIDP